MTIRTLPPEPVHVTQTVPQSITLDANSFGIASTPHIFVVTIAAANTEQSLALPSDAKGFEIKARKNSLLRFAFTASGTDDGGNYIEISPGASYEKAGSLNMPTSTLYLRSANMPEFVQVTVYT